MNNKRQPYQNKRPLDPTQSGQGAQQSKFHGGGRMNSGGQITLGKRSHDEMNCDLDSLIKKDRYDS